MPGRNRHFIKVNSIATVVDSTTVANIMNIDDIHNFSVNRPQVSGEIKRMNSRHLSRMSQGVRRRFAGSKLTPIS